MPVSGMGIALQTAVHRKIPFGNRNLDFSFFLAAIHRQHGSWFFRHRLPAFLGIAAQNSQPMRQSRGNGFQ